MQQLIKENKELKAEHGLEKNNALKALYHSEVTDGGKYQVAYQALDQPKKQTLISNYLTKNSVINAGWL